MAMDPRRIKSISTILRLLGVLLVLSSFILMAFMRRFERWMADGVLSDVLREMALQAFVYVVGGGLLVVTAVFLVSRSKRKTDTHDYVSVLERMGREKMVFPRETGAAAENDGSAADIPREILDNALEGSSPESVLLVSDVTVPEAERLCTLLVEKGLRVDVQVRSLGNSLHLFGNGGMETRMDVYIHKDDYDAALLLVGDRMG